MRITHRRNYCDCSCRAPDLTTRHSILQIPLAESRCNLKIILKYILTNVRERKMRTAVMLLSILLSTTLLFVSFSIGASYESAQRKMARGIAGTATISVSSQEGFIDPDDIPDLPAAGAKAGMLKVSALYHEDGYYETVDLAASDLTQLEEINPPRMADGSKIESFTGSEVILPDRFTSKYNIQKGDTITLTTGQEEVRLEVAGIAAYDTVFLRHTRGVTALLPFALLSELSGSDGGYSEVLLKPAGGYSTDDLKDALEEVLPDEQYLITETVNEAQVEADARQKSMPFFLISFFSMTMSVFIIFSSYKVITLDRLPVIGTFRSIGATQKAVTRILLLESTLYGCFGGLAGIPAGILVLKLVLQGMGNSLSQGIEIPVVITPFSVLFSFAAAMIVSLLSAWLPVRRASRLPVKAVVLGTVEEKQVSHRFTAVTGIVVFVISVFLPKAASGNLLYLAGGFSLLGMIAASILLIPLLTNLLSRGLEHVYGTVLGNEGRLAARNMRGNKNISQNITLLFISISAVIAITVVGNFVTAYVSDVFQGAGLQGFADGHMEPEFVEQVTEMDGVGQVLPLYVFDSRLQADGITFARAEATDHLESYNSMLALHYTDQSMEKASISAFNTGRCMILSESCMEQTGFSVGDTVTLSDGDREFPYQITGSFKSRATDVEAIIPSACAVSDFGAAAYDFLAYTAADPDAIMVQIRSLFGETPNWSRTVEEFNEDALSTVGTFLRPMHSMTWFILLLAAVGIINNLLINYIQKRRTIAMYKSVGLSSRQNIKMTLTEAFSSGLIGAAAAIFVSYMEIRTIFLVAGPKISMVPELHADTFLLSGVLGILVTLAGSLVPVFKSRRMKLVEEIKFE